MRRWLRFVIGTGVAAGAVLLALARYSPAERNARAAWSALTLRSDGEAFRPETVENLPDPARRFLLRAIAPRTPLARSAELSMSGEIVLDPDRPPLRMSAQQILAPPQGFVWRARAASGVMRIHGFDLYADDRGAMRWKLWGVVPVGSATGRDIDRSAAGRLAMESILMPAVLVPGRGATWEAVDDSRARFHLTVGKQTVVTTLEVDPQGRPLSASALRWLADARPDGPGYDIFAVEFEGDFVAGGYTIPRRIVAGWRLGQEDEFRFFDATLDNARFRRPPRASVCSS